MSGGSSLRRRGDDSRVGLESLLTCTRCSSRCSSNPRTSCSKTPSGRVAGRAGPAARSRSGRALVEPETDLQLHLELAARTVIDPPPDVGDLKPVQIVQ